MIAVAAWLLAAATMPGVSGGPQIVGETCGANGCTPVLAAPPPWRTRTATPPIGAAWLVGVPTAAIGRRLRRGAAVARTIDPRDDALGEIVVETASCSVSLFTKPVAQGGGEVWDVGVPFARDGASLNAADARRCLASLR